MKIKLLLVFIFLLFGSIQYSTAIKFCCSCISGEADDDDDRTCDNESTIHSKGEQEKLLSASPLSHHTKNILSTDEAAKKHSSLDPATALEYSSSPEQSDLYDSTSVPNSTDQLNDESIYDKDEQEKLLSASPLSTHSENILSNGKAAEQKSSFDHKSALEYNSSPEQSSHYDPTSIPDVTYNKRSFKDRLRGYEAFQFRCSRYKIDNKYSYSDATYNIHLIMGAHVFPSNKTVDAVSHKSLPLLTNNDTTYIVKMCLNIPRTHQKFDDRFHTVVEMTLYNKSTTSREYLYVYRYYDPLTNNNRIKITIRKNKF